MGRYDRFTDAFKNAIKNPFEEFDKEGPAIEVSPFAPGEATTGAGILRAITAIAGARRSRANWNAEQKFKNESRYKDALERQLLEQKLEGTDAASIIARDNAASMDRYRTGMLDLRRKPPAKPKSAAERAANAALVRLALDQFDKQGESFADQAMGTVRVGTGGKRHMPIDDFVQKLAAGLSAPTASGRLKAAEALGVKPMAEPSATAVTEKDPATGKNRTYFPVVPVLKDGLPVFDPKEVSAAIQSWKATRRAGLLNQWKSENAPRRSVYEQALMQMSFGDVDEPSDPLEEAALELFGD